MLLFIGISVLLFALGAMVGSFLNVVIYRTLDEVPVKRKESWVSGWSRCDFCKKRIQWFDNIPLLSFLLLRGKCRYCQAKIGLAHPVVELLVGTLFVWWFWGGAVFFQLTQEPFQVLQPMFWLAVGILLVIITLADIRYWIIPDWAVTALTILTVVYRVVLVSAGVMRPLDFATAVLVTLASFLFLGSIWLVTKKQGIGLGDVKLMIPLGMLLGWPVMIVNLFLAFLMGAVVGVILIAMQKRHANQAIPFGPFLVAASCVSLLWGDQLLEWYLALLR